MTVCLDRANPPKIRPEQIARLKAMIPEEIQRHAEADPFAAAYIKTIRHDPKAVERVLADA